MEKQIKKVHCPVCGQELVSLSAVKTRSIYGGFRKVTEYWCDVCSIDIEIAKTEYKEED